jgi:hypothetical protein
LLFEVVPTLLHAPGVLLPTQAAEKVERGAEKTAEKAREAQVRNRLCKLRFLMLFFLLCLFVFFCRLLGGG